MKMLTAEGSYEEIGYKIGIESAEEIKNNISLCKDEIKAKGIKGIYLTDYINSYANSLNSSSIDMIKGMSRGSRIPFESILGFNAVQEILMSEECTTFAAIGEATSNGKVVLLKNRDTSGIQNVQSDTYHENWETNIVLAIKTLDGNKIFGVTKAGSTGIMMGMNKYGVGVASNFGHIAEVSKLKKSQLYGASGRPQMLREALKYSTAKEAVCRVLTTLTNSPMVTPGMIFVVDSKGVFVIEGGTESNMFAVQQVTDGVISRSNYFLMLDQLNGDGEISSICRKFRANELIKENYGKIDKKKLMEFSVDHKNGPGNLSICRHSKNPEDSVTVSAAIMEIDRDNPDKSTIDIALGSPCHAWNSESGHITIRMDEEIESIQQSYLDGTAFKQNFNFEPFKG